MFTLGSLCSGFGGLEMATELAGIKFDMSWYAEHDTDDYPTASKVMAYHHPGLPNLGDITAVDWTRVEPVDILTAGYPCQDLSNAGKRAGIEGDRSGIWRNVADAVRVLRPRLVILENVAAHIGRGFGRVLGDLAACGYDARWVCVRASAVGAPHQRDRRVSESAFWVDGLAEAVYHADSALSSSGARMLARDGAAAFRWAAENPAGPKKEFDHGHAAHRLVLGAGPDIAVVEADSWRTKKAREQGAEHRAAGKVPLLRKDYDVVCAMAAKIFAHPLAAALLSDPAGVSERSLFWTDPTFGVRCRARLDRWTRLRSGRWVVADFKTTTSVRAHKLTRTFFEYRYCQQADWYQNGVIACGLDDNPGFLFVAQDKTPPYAVQVIDYDPEAMTYAARQNRKALQMFRDCTQSGVWPEEEMSHQILTLSLPRYVDTEEDTW